MGRIWGGGGRRSTEGKKGLTHRKVVTTTRKGVGLPKCPKSHWGGYDLSGST